MRVKNGTAKDMEFRVTEFRTSGQAARDWCSENSINLHTLRYWLYKVGGHGASRPASPVKWLSVEMAGDIDRQPVSGGGIVVHIGDARIEVEPGCDLILLREVVQTLATLC